MERSDYLAALQRDGAAFAESISKAGLRAPVVACPEWNTADLLYHLAEVHYFWTTIVEQRAASPDNVSAWPRPPDDELMDAYRRQVQALVAALTDTDPATEVWTWSAQHDVAFILRRMTQETAVHRWDADRAADRSTPIDAELASDGIDEFLHHFLTNSSTKSEPIGGSVHIHCGDVAGEWTVRPNDAGYDIAREHSKGDCALRGSASDLLLALWRRVGVDAIDVVGDTGVATRFLAATDLE
jgi:uncharacterized protein (TIGR03083 family)